MCKQRVCFVAYVQRASAYVCIRKYAYTQMYAYINMYKQRGFCVICAQRARAHACMHVYIHARGRMRYLCERHLGLHMYMYVCMYLCAYTHTI